MAALLSPGVSVSVIDESQYTPTAAGTIPYILLATAQDKLTPSSTTALGTTAANADKLLTITSQRELISTFGYPVFQQDAQGNPIHAHELNEYGLLAAYSALGVANRVYVQRADVDLNQLIGTSVRPTGTPSDGIHWLDQTASNLGLHEFVNGTGFVKQAVLNITDEAYLDSNGVPLSSFGAIGQYASNSTIASSPVYFKRPDNIWALIGSDDWKLGQPTITGTIANPTTLATGQMLRLNGANVVLTGSTVTSAAADITNALITGVFATVNLTGQLQIRINGTAASNGSTADGKLSITLGSAYGVTDAAQKLGLFSAAEVAAGNVKVLNSPTIQFSDYRDVPAWKASDVVPRPNGSVWFKTSATGNGAVYSFKRYNATSDNFTLLSTPLYASQEDAIYGLDPVGGGAGIAAGSTFVHYDIGGNNTAQFIAYVKHVAGLVKATGSIPVSPVTYTAGDSFNIEVSVPGSAGYQAATITLTAANPAVSIWNATAQSLVGDILAANLPNIVATVEASGAVSISHLAGGTIRLSAITGSPLTTLGLVGANQDACPPNVYYNSSTLWTITPWAPLLFTFSDTAPYSNPADGALWYYNNALDVDIMIHDGTNGWKGYHNVANDARGYDLGATDPFGPILSASQPGYQTDGTTRVVPGELWIDTSDLENYPVIRRYTGAIWEMIDNTDQVNSDGIVFADARWSHNGSINPIVDSLPSIETLSNSNYLDSDAPDFRLYARGTLLFNTRRSGYNVKRFESAYLTDVRGVGVTFEAGTWVSHSGVDAMGVPYFGHKAQRNTVVESLKSAIETSVNLREEQVEFNLIVCPGYPELIQNMITLNNDRKSTAFIIGDSPLTLNSSSSAIAEWASNANFAVDNGTDGLVSTSEYLGVYYPSGYATNLDGNSVVVPASHAMLRTYIRSDNQSYPWFAPAGVRRGVLDNISSIGYVDLADGSTFKSIGVTVGLRDVLYTNRVNPLTVLPGVGLVAYGQKTRAAMTSAMDRVNVARLVCYLRLVLDKVARPYIFEPNDTITRNQVKGAFEAVLNDIVAKRGIYDYLVVCDTSNNTPDRIDRNELYIDIAIEPVKAIEFIYIPVRLKGTGGIAAGL
jgi:hypothetical protein